MDAAVDLSDGDSDGDPELEEMTMQATDEDFDFVNSRMATIALKELDTRETDRDIHAAIAECVPRVGGVYASPKTVKNLKISLTKAENAAADFGRKISATMHRMHTIQLNFNERLRLHSAPPMPLEELNIMNIRAITDDGNKRYVMELFTGYITLWYDVIQLTEKYDEKRELIKQIEQRLAAIRATPLHMPRF